MFFFFFSVVLVFSLSLSSIVVRADYPPPQELGYDYYTFHNDNNNNNGGTASRLVTGGAEGIGGGGGGGRGVSLIGNWNGKDYAVPHNPFKCLKMPSNLTLCQDVGYSEMKLPNLLRHDTVKEVTQQASTWVRLTKVRCHRDAQIFLCSLFAPFCLQQDVWPCRSLCEAVKSGCEHQVLKYGFPWPEMLRCDQFPPDADLCIGLRDDQQTDDNMTTVCPACSQPLSDEAIMEEFCKADFVMRIKVEQSLVTGNDKQVVPSKKKKVFRSSLAKAKELRGGNLFIEGGASCDCPALEGDSGNDSDRQLIVAGNRTHDRLVLSLIQKGSKALRRALRNIRKTGVCREIETTPTLTSSGKSGRGNDEKKKTDQRKTPSSSSKTVRPSVKTPGRPRGRSNASDGKRIPTGSTSQRQSKEEKQRHKTSAITPSPTRKPGSKKPGQQRTRLTAEGRRIQ